MCVDGDGRVGGMEECEGKLVLRGRFILLNRDGRSGKVRGSLHVLIDWKTKQGGARHGCFVKHGGLLLAHFMYLLFSLS